MPAKKCEHNRQKSRCKECDLGGHMKYIVAVRIRRALTSKSNHTIEYLGCDIKFYIGFIEAQFNNKMNWDNYGTYWEIDHVVPVNWHNPSAEEKILRLHYTNTQPLSKEENMKKSNNLRLIEDLDKIERFYKWKGEYYQKFNCSLKV